MLLIVQEREVSLPLTVKLPTFKGDGTHPGVDVNCNAALHDCMELSDEESAASLP